MTQAVYWHCNKCGTDYRSAPPLMCGCCNLPLQLMINVDKEFSAIITERDKLNNKVIRLREAINRWVRSPCHGHCSCGNCGALISISRETEGENNGQ